MARASFFSDATAARNFFDGIYREYNKRELVSPDPLQFLYEYDDEADREVVGLIASSFAYGRVAQILKSVRRVLDVLGERPSEVLREAPRALFEEKLKGFVHRFSDERETVDFLVAIGNAVREYGSLEALFARGFRGDMTEAVENFSARLCRYAGREKMFLLPRPSKGSACKRIALFLRWATRRDEVDPGGWSATSPKDLLVPLDAHMFNIASGFGFCSRRCASGAAAAEITEKFRAICPEDPVKYDFALTRFGIRQDLSVSELFARRQKSRA